MLTCSNKLVIGIAGCALALTAADAADYVPSTGFSLLDALTHSRTFEPDHIGMAELARVAAAEGFIFGLALGLADDHAICFPTGGLSVDNATTLVRGYLQKNPEQLAQSASRVASDALRLSLPCSR